MSSLESVLRAGPLDGEEYGCVLAVPLPVFLGTLFVEILYTYALDGKYRLSILLFLSPAGVSASFSHIYVLQNQHPTICGLPLW